MHAVLQVSETNRSVLGALAALPPDLIVLDAGDLPKETLVSLAAQARAQAPGVPVFVRSEPLAGRGQDQLAADLAAAPDGIWLGDTVGRVHLEQLASRLAVAEAELAMPDGAFRIIASVESAAGVLALSSLAGSGQRLAAVALDSPSLARDIGCETGPLLPEPLRAARGAVLLAAAAARVPAIASAGSVLADLETFAAEATLARRDGFSATLARDERQIEVVRRLPGQARVGRWIENFVSGVATK